MEDRKSRNNINFIRVFEEEKSKHWNRTNIWNCNPRKLSGNKGKPEFIYWKSSLGTEKDIPEVMNSKIPQYKTART